MPLKHIERIGAADLGAGSAFGGAIRTTTATRCARLSSSKARDLRAQVIEPWVTQMLARTVRAFGERHLPLHDVLGAIGARSCGLGRGGLQGTAFGTFRMGRLRLAVRVL